MTKKTEAPTKVNVQVELTPEEAEILEKLRSGKPIDSTKKLDDKEILYIKSFDSQLTQEYTQLGMITEQILLAASNITGIKQAKQVFLEEMRSKYGIPGNRDWRIDLSTGEISIEDEVKEEPQGD